MFNQGRNTVHSQGYVTVSFFSDPSSTYLILAVTCSRVVAAILSVTGVVGSLEVVGVAGRRSHVLVVL